MVAVMWDDEVWLPPNITWEYFDHDDRCLTALHHIHHIKNKINNKDFSNHKCGLVFVNLLELGF